MRDVLVATAVCPHPPLLLPGVTGAAGNVLPELTAACAAAVADLIAAEPDCVVVVAADPSRVQPARTAACGVGGYTAGRVRDAVVPGAVEPSTEQVSPSTEQLSPGTEQLSPGTEQLSPGAAQLSPDTEQLSPGAEHLSLGLAVGQSLLDAAGWRGRRVLCGVAPDLSPQAAADLGRQLLQGHDRVGMLVLGDGSARRDRKAPGYLDPRAEGFDAAVRAGLAGQPQVLLDLDPGLAEELLAAGRTAWQVLAGAWLASTAALAPAAPALIADDSQGQGRIRYAEAPFGVGYLVASWRPGPYGSLGIPAGS